MTRPWEYLPTDARPWEGNLLAPRTVTIQRPALTGTGGGIGAPTLTTIATGVPASIQFRSKPILGDAAGLEQERGDWAIFITKADAWAAFGADGPSVIQARDVLIADDGLQYEAATVWWDSLGYQVRAKLLPGRPTA